MADRVPLRLVNVNGTVTIGEFQTGDTVGIVHGGTGVSSIDLLKNVVGLDSLSLTYSLSDVNITSPQNSDVLVYFSGTDEWRNAIPIAGGSAVDHGLLTGLSNNDHPQYLLSSVFNSHEADNTIHFVESEIDHGAIGGLGDNDHPQYVLSSTNSALSASVSSIESSTVDISAYINANEGMWMAGGSLDHSALLGLSANDHPQYVLSSTNQALSSLVTSVEGSTVSLSSYIAANEAIWSADADVSTLSGLGDTTISSPVDGQIIVWDEGGQVWLNDHLDHTVAKVYNNTAAIIYRGDVVTITGAHNANTAYIDLARADSQSTMPAIGVAQADIAINGEGLVVTFGRAAGLNTSGMTEGGKVYVSPTTKGGITQTRPTATNHLVQNVGVVMKADATNGVIKVTGIGRSNDVDNVTLNNISTLSSLTASIETSTVDISAYIAANEAAWSTDNDTTDHTLLTNIGTNTHAQIDSHIADSTIHFTEASIDHGSIAGLSDNDHPQYVLSATNQALSSLVTSVEGSTVDISAYIAANETQWATDVNPADHSALNFLDANDHPQYVLSSTNSALSAQVDANTSAIDNALDLSDIVTYIEHGDLNGLGDNDHPQYVLSATNQALSSLVTSVEGSTVNLSSYIAANEGTWSTDTDTTDHTALTNIGTNTHAQIDSHIADITKHFTVASIDHGSIAGLGDNDHPQYVLSATNQALSSLVTNIETSTVDISAYIAANEAQWATDVNPADHSALNFLDANDHPQYVLSSTNQALSSLVTSVEGSTVSLSSYIAANEGTWSTDTDTTDHTALTNIGTNTHAQIDSHIADSTIHFTEASIDHGSIAGLGDNDHPQYVLSSTNSALSSTVTSKVNKELVGHYIEPWEEGSGNQNAPIGWTTNGVSSLREFDTNPFGDQSIIWKAIDVLSGLAGEGGFNSGKAPADSSSLHRFSCFIKQENPASGTVYFGPYAYSSLDPGVTFHQVNIRASNAASGTGTTNKYFIGNQQMPSSDWYLAVAYLLPYQTETGPVSRQDTALYKVSTGEKVSFDIYDYMLDDPEAIGLAIRAYHYNNPAGTGDTVQFFQPRIDVVDGNEPSIADLLRIVPRTDYVLSSTNLALSAQVEANTSAIEDAYQLSDIEAFIDHGNIAGLSDNDHPQYVLSSTNQALSSLVTSIETSTVDISAYIAANEAQWATDVNPSDHSALNFLDANDHPQYVLSATNLALSSQVDANTADISNLGSASANWNSTYGTVNSLSSTWEPETAAEILTKLLTVDGAGSNLDADKLDGKDSYEYIQNGSYVQPFNVFGTDPSDAPRKIYASHLTDRFLGRESEIYVAKNGTEIPPNSKASLFDGSWDTVGITESAGGSDFTVSVDMSAYGLTNTNGFTYSDGFFILGYYPGKSASGTPSGVWYDRNNTSGTLSFTQETTYGSAPIAWRITGMPYNYLVKFDITIPANGSGGSDIWIAVLEYHGSRMGKIEGPLIDVAGGSFYGEINGELQGVKQWYIQQDGDADFNSLSINASQVVSPAGNWTGNNLDHTTDLNNVGTNTHAQIDSHIADSSLHFTEASIDHGSIGGLADNDHPQYVLSATNQTLSSLVTSIETSTVDISSYIAANEGSWSTGGATDLSTLGDTAISSPTNGQSLNWNGTAWVNSTPATGVTDHGLLTGLSDNDHPQYVLSSTNQALSSLVTSVEGSTVSLSSYIAANESTWSTDTDTTDHTALTNIGTNTHAQIDSHIADSTIHFTEASIDHGSIAGLADNDHPQYLLSSTYSAASGSWESAYQTVNSLSGSWEESPDISYVSGVVDDNTADIAFLGAASGNWQTAYTTDLFPSATGFNNWNSVYASVNSTSGNWNTAYTTDLFPSATGFGDWDSVYASVNSASANWNTAYTTDLFPSATGFNNWNTIYADRDNLISVSSTVLDNSANWQSAYTTDLFPSATGFNNWNNVYTSVNSTSANWDSAYSTDLFPSATGFNNWDSVYASVNSASSNWDTAYTTDLFPSATGFANWNTIYADRSNLISVSSTVLDNSGNWQTAYTTDLFPSATGFNNWNNVYTSVNSTSGNWNTAYTTDLFPSATGFSDWDSVYASVNSTSANWDSAYSTDLFPSATGFNNWNSVYTSVNSASSNWDTAYTTDLFPSAVGFNDWNSVYASVNSTSSNWDTAYSTDLFPSATGFNDWNNVYTSVNSTSGNWNTAYSTDLFPSATGFNDWNSVYANVNSASSNWESTYQTVSTTSSTWGGGGGVTDHGALTGLLDNDHPQYVLSSTNLALSTLVQDTTDVSGIVHGNLSALDADDHTQYVLADGTRTASSLQVSGDLSVTGSVNPIHTGILGSTDAGTFGLQGTTNFSMVGAALVLSANTLYQFRQNGSTSYNAADLPGSMRNWDSVYSTVNSTSGTWGGGGGGGVAAGVTIVNTGTDNIDSAGALVPLDTSTSYPAYGTYGTDYSYTAGNSYVTINTAGTYEVTFNAGFTSTGQRWNGILKIYKGTGGASPSSWIGYGAAKMGYIRAASGHNESSLILTCLVTCSANDTIGGWIEREAITATCTLVANETYMTIKRMA